MLSWKFNEAYAIIDSWDDSRKLEGLICRARLHNHQGDFNEALMVINSAVKVAEQKNDVYHEFYAMAIKANILIKLGKMEDVNDLFDKGHKMITEFDIELNKSSRWAQAYFYNYYGIYKMLNGDMDRSLFTFQKTISIQIEIEDLRGLASTTQNIAYFYKITGDFENARKNYDKSRDYHLALNYPYGIAVVLSNIGDILRIQGKVLEAKDHLLKSIETFLTVNGNPNPHIIANTYQRIGRIHMLLNDHEHAQWNFSAAMEILEQGYHPVSIAGITFDMILLMMEVDNEEEFENWLLKLQILSDENSENKTIGLQLKFIKALKLSKSSNRLKSMVEASTIFLDIIESEIISHEITVLSMIHYLEILFVELRIQQNQEVIDQIHKYLRTILEIATQQKSIALMIETYILNSRVALSTLNTNHVNNQLNLALKLATDHDITFLITKVKKEQKLASQFLERLDKQMEYQSSLSSRIDEIDISSYLKDVSKIVRS